MSKFYSSLQKPPLIHPSSILDFSLKYETLFPLILIAPNLAVGLTAVKVAIDFVFLEILTIYQYQHHSIHPHTLKNFHFQLFF